VHTLVILFDQVNLYTQRKSFDCYLELYTSQNCILPTQYTVIPSRQSDVETTSKRHQRMSSNRRRKRRWKRKLNRRWEIDVVSTLGNRRRFNVWKSTSFQRLWFDVVSTSGNPFRFHVSFSTSYRCLKAGENSNRIGVGVMTSFRHACFYVNLTQTQRVLASAFPIAKEHSGHFLKIFIHSTYTLIHTKIYI
jgi:hypothetical protein